MQLYNSKLPLNLKSIESIKLHLLINYTFEKSEREKNFPEVFQKKKKKWQPRLRVLF